MMKKLLIVAATLLVSAQVNAAAVGFNGSTRSITPLNCEVLSNNVTIQLSKDVSAAYNCDATSFLAAACHTNGTNKSQTLECVYYEDPLSPGDYLPYASYLAAGCTAQAGGIPDPVPTVTYTGRVAFGAGSGGGRVTSLPFPQDSCTTATIVEATPDRNLDSGASTSN